MLNSCHISPVFTPPSPVKIILRKSPIWEEKNKKGAQGEEIEVTVIWGEGALYMDPVPHSLVALLKTPAFHKELTLPSALGHVDEAFYTRYLVRVSLPEIIWLLLFCLLLFFQKLQVTFFFFSICKTKKQFQKEWVVQEKRNFSGNEKSLVQVPGMICVPMWHQASVSSLANWRGWTGLRGPEIPRGAFRCPDSVFLGKGNLSANIRHTH